MNKSKYFIAVAMFFVAISSAFAYAGDDISVTIDGVRVDFENQHSVIAEGRTLVPVRGVFERLGFDVGWDGGTRRVTLENARTSIELTIGSDIFTINGERHALDVPAQIINGSTMIPLRAVLENIGHDIYWDGTTRTVVITRQRPDHFANLAQIIGEDRASLLTPILVSQEGEREHGISIEFMAAAVHDTMVDVYVTLRDSYANRLDEDFQISFTMDRQLHHGRVYHMTLLNVPGFFLQPSSFLTYELIDRNEITGDVTFFIREEVSLPFYHLGIPFTINSISYNNDESSNVEIPINFTQDIPMCPPVDNRRAVTTPLRIADDLNIPMSESIIVREARLNSYALFLAVRDLSDSLSDVEQELISIHTTQGIVNVHSGRLSGRRDGVRGVTFSLATENGFLNLETVTAVEIAGVVLDLSPNAEPRVNEITVLVNDQPVIFQAAQPTVTDWRVMLPLHELFAAMGFDVSNDYPEELITICGGITTIALNEGYNYTVTVNNKRIFVNAQIPLQNDVLMLPLSLILITDIAYANWDDVTRTVSISTERDAPAYRYLAFSSQRLWDRRHEFTEPHIEVVTSASEFAALDISSVSYSEEFFEDNTLVAVFLRQIDGSAFLQSVNESGEIAFEIWSCGSVRQAIFLIELSNEVVPTEFDLTIINTCYCWQCEWARA